MAPLLQMLVAALLVVLAQAAPRERVDLSKRSFKIPVHRAHGAHKDPVQAMHRVARKYGWAIIVFDPSAAAISTITTILPDLPTATGSALQPTSTSPPPVSSTFPQPPSSASAGSGGQSSGNTTYSPPSGRPLAPTTTVPSSSTPSPTSAEGGEVSAIPEANDSEYLSPVTIGGQTFSLDFDSGSSDLWVFSDYLPANQRTGHSSFNPNLSSTWQFYENGHWQISYGDGSGASGVVGFDTVDIGGATVQHQAIGLASKIASSFLRDTNNDGLVGLAFSTLNTITPKPQQTFFENVRPHLASPLFTADLADDASGTYEFGLVDATKYTGAIHYTPINTTNGFWQFPSPSYHIANKTYPCKTCSPTIADTGTSLMMLDEDIVEAYYATIPGATYDAENGGYTLPCSSRPSMPDFGVAVGQDYMAVLSGSETVYKDLGGDVCFGGIQGNQGQGVQILGDVFFKQFFAVFDGMEGQETFGVALKGERDSGKQE